jgi:hypothetical protein
MRGDGRGLDDRHVSDEQAHHALAVARRRLGTLPEAGKRIRQGGHLLSLSSIELVLILRPLLLGHCLSRR